MAISAASVHEVQNSASDLNGGGFVAGASGTDYSQSTSPHVTFDGATIFATTAGVGAIITITGYTVAAGDVGNLVAIAGGTNFTAGLYQILSVNTGSNTWTLDRNCTSGAGAAMTGRMGGCLTTISQVATNMIAGNKAFVKAGSGYTQTATVTFAQTQTVSGTAPLTSLIGYTTTRTDGGVVAITLSTNTGLFGISFSGVGWNVANFAVNCSSLGTSTGIRLNAGYSIVRNCKVSNFTLRGIQAGSDKLGIYDCEVTGGTAAATCGITFAGSGGQALRCWVHDNACTAVIINFFGQVQRCIIANNTGASSDGIQGSSIYGSLIEHNTIYKCGRDAIRITGANTLYGLEIRNNIFAQNTGWGINNTNAAYAAHPMFDGNAYYSNTAGARNNIDDTGSTNAVNAASPYTNVFDVTLSGDPFTSAAGNDFSLNTTAGAGASCRGAGTPGTPPGMSNVGHPDMGALQHTDPVGGGLLYTGTNLEGV